MSFVTIADGITVQHAAELLFGVEDTRLQRSSCALTYLRSLEDTAFALLFSETMAVSGTMPKVGKTFPGRKLLKQFSHRVTNLDFYEEITKEQILADPDDRDHIKGLFLRFSDMPDDSLPYWIEFFIRETAAYFGSHPSRLKRFKNPNEYIFDKNYWIDRDLEDSIPIHFVEALFSRLQNIRVVPPRCGNAYREFIRRSILAHVLIFVWYQRTGIKGFRYSERTRLPHITRTTFLSDSPVPNFTWMVRDAVMPRVLGWILSGARDRRDVRRRLQDLSVDSSIANYAKRFTLAVHELTSGNDIPGEKLLGELERLTIKSASTPTIKHKVGVGLAISPHSVEPKLSYEISRELATSDRFSYILRSNEDEWNSLLDNATRVFPELRTGNT